MGELAILWKGFMSNIYAGMLSPEKMGVSGSRWATIEQDTVTITNMRIHTARIGDLKLQGYTIVHLDTDKIRFMVKGML